MADACKECGNPAHSPGDCYVVDLAPPHNFHAIEGPNGLCACGVDAAGVVTRCGDLLEAYVQARIQLAMVGPRPAHRDDGADGENVDGANRKSAQERRVV